MSAEDVGGGGSKGSGRICRAAGRSYVPGGLRTWDVRRVGSGHRRDFGPVCPITHVSKPKTGDVSARRINRTALEQAYLQKETNVVPQVMRYIEKEVICHVDHIGASIWRAWIHRQALPAGSYSQKNSEAGYNREAFDLSPPMLDRINFDTLTTVSKIPVRSQKDRAREDERPEIVAGIALQHAEACQPFRRPAAPRDEGCPLIPGFGGLWFRGRERPWSRLIRELPLRSRAPFVRECPNFGPTTVRGDRAISTSLPLCLAASERLTGTCAERRSQQVCGAPVDSRRRGRCDRLSGLVLIAQSA